MPNVIRHVTIHDLRKNGSAFEVVAGTAGRAITPTVQRVVDELHDLYSKRASKAHGKFSADEDNYPVQRFLKEFLDGGSVAFNDLTARMMNTLAAKAANTAATGGHVFFAAFERDGRTYLMVAIVNDRLGATLTQALELKDTQHLDLDGFRFAGRVNITGWLAAEERYVGFLKGKGDVAEYFKEFLGCDTTVQDRVDTNALVNVIKDFATSQGMNEQERDRFLHKAKTICDDLAKRREPISFQVLANELYPTAPNELVEKLADPELCLCDGFVPDRKALGSLVKFKARTSLWSVEFDRQAMTDGMVQFNEGDATLTLRGLPQELVAALRADNGTDDGQDHV